MTAVLSVVTSKLGIGLIAVLVVAGMWIWIQNLSGRLDDAKAELATAEAVIQQSLDAIKVLEDVTRAEIDRLNKSMEIRKRIENAPDKDAPIGDAVRGVLDGLRDRSQAPAPSNT